MKPSLKILICYHKPSHLFKDDIFTPIHVGRALAKRNMSADDERLAWLTSNMIGDDTGDNISHKNSSYNELTAVYWAWKNYDKLGNPDYIGLMHYRRHFIFREAKFTESLVDKIDDNYYPLINYSPEAIKDILSETDLVFHEGKVGSIKGHYANNHRIEDLYSAISIIDDVHPSYSRTAHKYLDQSYGSFCNMFIFPKKIFFEYCDWLFKILDVYESVNDLTNKRLFVSERLTGIFIQRKIDDGYRYKNFPITLIKEPVIIPVAMPWEDDLFSTSVSILSHSINAEPDTGYAFHIIGKPDEYSIECLEKLSEDYEFDLNIINPDQVLKQCGIDADSVHLYPLILHILIANVNKCVYLSNRMLSARDESELYRTCNVDDFWVCGIPKDDDDPTSENRVINTDLLVLNLKRFRDYKLHESYREIICKDETDADTILHVACGEENIGYFPPWFYKKSTTENRSDLFDENKGRSALQSIVRWTPYIYFNSYSPIYSMQGIYSKMWWDVASKVPGYIQSIRPDIGKVHDIMLEQQPIIRLESNRRSTFFNLKSLRDKIPFMALLNKFKVAHEKYGLRETFRIGFEYARRRVL